MIIKIKTQVLTLFLLANLSTNAQSNQSKIDSLIQAYVAIHQFNGSALVLQNGLITYQKSFGYSNANLKTPVTKNSIYPIASLTKPFTALIILKLAEENKLSVNDPLSKYIPDFPRGNDIHIKDLLTHTAGLYEPTRNSEYLKQVDTHQAFSPREKIAFFKNQPLDFEPGTKFSYTNSGYDLLGMIIEKVTKLSYAKAVSTYIFDPLKMHKSGFNFADLKDKNKVLGYSFISPARQTEVVFWNGTLTYASGGLYSTTGDLAKLYKGLHQYKVVSEKTFEHATTPFLGGYGMGWFIDTIYKDRVIDHGGNIPGATSYFLMMPERNTGIILLNNITSNVLEKIGNSIYALLINQPYNIPKPKQEVPLEEIELRKYVGQYDVNANYIVNVSEEAGKLFISINNQKKAKLSAISEKKFFIKDDDMDLEFIFKNGTVVQLMIKQGLATKVGDKIK